MSRTQRTTEIRLSFPDLAAYFIANSRSVRTSGVPHARKLRFPRYLEWFHPLPNLFPRSHDLRLILTITQHVNERFYTSSVHISISPRLRPSFSGTIRQAILISRITTSATLVKLSLPSPRGLFKLANQAPKTSLYSCRTNRPAPFSCWQQRRRARAHAGLERSQCGGHENRRSR